MTDADVRLDLRGTPCPMNWVKLKLQLEELEQGQLLEVVLDDGEAMLNVPRSAKAEGHVILRATPLEAPESAGGEAASGGFSLLIEKGGARAPRPGGEK